MELPAARVTLGADKHSLQTELGSGALTSPLSQDQVTATWCHWLSSLVMMEQVEKKLHLGAPFASLVHIHSWAEA